MGPPWQTSQRGVSGTSFAAWLAILLPWPSLTGCAFAFVEARTRPSLDDIFAEQRDAGLGSAEAHERLHQRLPGEARAVLGPLAAGPPTSAPAGEGGEPRPVALEEALRLALRDPDRLLIAAEGLTRAHVDVIRSYGNLLPVIRYRFAYARQDRGVPSLAGGARTDELLERQRLSRFTLTQPLFRGLSELWNIDRAHAAQAAAELDALAARAAVTAEVAARFYDALEAEAAGRHAAAALALWQQLAGPGGAGAAGGEPGAAGTHAARIEARRAARALAEADEAARAAREALTLLTGIARTAPLALPGYGATPQARAISGASLETLCEAALALRPDLEARRRRAEAADLSARMSYAEVLPEARFTGNLYHARDGLREHADWDLAFEIDAGVYEGWRGSAAVARAESSARESWAVYREAARAALLGLIERTHAARAAGRTAALAGGDLDAARASGLPAAVAEAEALTALESLRAERRLFELALEIGEDPVDGR